MPFIQITIAEGHDATTKRALVTQVSAAAAAATGTPEAAWVRLFWSESHAARSRLLA